MNLAYDPVSDCPMKAAPPMDDGGYGDLRAKLYALLSSYPQPIAIQALRKTLVEWQAGS